MMKKLLFLISIFMISLSTFCADNKVKFELVPYISETETETEPKTCINVRNNAKGKFLIVSFFAELLNKRDPLLLLGKDEVCNIPKNTNIPGFAGYSFDATNSMGNERSLVFLDKAILEQITKIELIVDDQGNTKFIYE